VEEYARGITIDVDALEEAVRSVDPSDPDALQEALSSGLFEPQATPQQRAALERLETALALVEGWIDEVVDTAAAATLPHREALRETVRRRRAAGGPAEHIFASLVGLELRPRRLREAAAVWAALTAERGTSGRDALWAHPDLAPTSESFADPTGFAKGGTQAEASGLDEAIAELLDNPPKDGPGDERPEGPSGDEPPEGGP
jgi:putative hydrolase